MEPQKKSKNITGILILIIIIVLGAVYLWMTKDSSVLNNGEINEIETLDANEYSSNAIEAYEELSNLEQELDLALEEIDLDSI
jgi:maltodextrin utilization protein YvdJ